MRNARPGLPSGSATQTFISNCERGERRIDLVELRTFCRAFGISLKQFAGQLERTMEAQRRVR